MQYELRAFQRVNTEPGLQLRFVHDLLRMHAAVLEKGLTLQDTNGQELTDEVKRETAAAIAQILEVFQSLYTDWQVDAHSVRLVSTIINQPQAEQSGVSYSNEWVEEQYIELEGN